MCYAVCLRCSVLCCALLALSLLFTLRTRTTPPHTLLQLPRNFGPRAPALTSTEFASTTLQPCSVWHCPRSQPSHWSLRTPLNELYVFRPAFSTQTTRARANVTAAGFHDTHRCDVQKQRCILPFSPVCSSDTTSSLYSTSLPLPCSPDNRSPRSSTFETFTSDPALIIAAHHTTAPSLLHSVSTALSPLFASIPWVLVLKLGIAMATDFSGAVDPETLYTKQQCIGKGIYTAETRQGADSLF